MAVIYNLTYHIWIVQSPFFASYLMHKIQYSNLFVSECTDQWRESRGVPFEGVRRRRGNQSGSVFSDRTGSPVHTRGRCIAFYDGFFRRGKSNILIHNLTHSTQRGTVQGSTFLPLSTLPLHCKTLYSRTCINPFLRSKFKFSFVAPTHFL